jgi:two-component system OmpR family response regulator
VGYVQESNGPLSVLVVDDLMDAAVSLATLLGLCGFYARPVCSGEDARRAAEESPPDAVVLDLKLPGMDGWELAWRLQKRVAPRGMRPFLVGVTGCGAEADRRESAAAGIDLHLLKPVEPAVLVGVLKRFAEVIRRPVAAS